MVMNVESHNYTTLHFCIKQLLSFGLFCVWIKCKFLEHSVCCHSHGCKNAETENEHSAVRANWRKFCSYGHKITANYQYGKDDISHNERSGNQTISKTDIKFHSNDEIGLTVVCSKDSKTKHKHRN